MKTAKEEIVETTHNGRTIFFSIVEKENDSGILYNDRIFFLLPEVHIGYLSESNYELISTLNFDKYKAIIPIANVKVLAIMEKELRIKFVTMEDNKRADKQWVLRMNDPALAKKWQDKLQSERIAQKNKQSVLKSLMQRTQSKNQISPNKHRQQSIIPQSSQKKRNMEISKNESIQYHLLQPMKPIEYKNIAIGESPRDAIQTKQIGTVMSEKSASIKPVKQTREIGTVVSQKNQPINRSQRLQKIEEDPKKHIQLSLDANQHESALKLSKDRQNGTISDRSLEGQGKLGSIRSEPVNTAQPIKYDRNLKNIRQSNANKMLQQNRITVDNAPSAFKKDHSKQRFYQQIAQPQLSRNVIENKSIKDITKGFERDTRILQPKIQPSMLEFNGDMETRRSGNKRQNMSNKQYITPDEFSKLKSSSKADYLERTSKLIQKSSFSRLQEQSKHVLQVPIDNNRATQFNKSNRIQYSTIKRLNTSKQDSLATNQLLKQSLLDKSIISNAHSKHSKWPITEVEQEKIIQNIRENYINAGQVKEEIIETQRHETIEYYSEENSFINIKQDQQLPWTFKYIKFNENIFGQFKNFTKNLMQEVIDDIIKPPQKRIFRHKYFRNNIYCYIIDDIEVKMAVIDIENIENAKKTERVCSKQGIKMIQNQFNSYHFLYQCLGQSKLKVPLVSLCEMNGFIALFKVLSKKLQNKVRMRSIEKQINQLKSLSKIDYDFYQNHNNCIIQLDEEYYKTFLKSQDGSVNFNCYFIQQVEYYLPPDLVTDLSLNNKLALLRKQLIERHCSSEFKHINPSKAKYFKKNTEANYRQVENICSNIFNEISNVIVEMDNLHVFFLSSKDFSSYLHEKGINLRYLGHIYSHLKSTFQKKFVMTEIAARSCKSLFRKTIQDISLTDQNITQQQINNKTCEFFNCVVGNTYQTAAVWKVLSSHSAAYYAVQLNFDEISKGYFLISLFENCKLLVNWEKIQQEQVFKTNLFFNNKNLLGLKVSHKIYHPHHNKKHMECLRILNQPLSQQGLSELINTLKIQEQLPSHLKYLSKDIKKYLSFFIDPVKAKEEGLKNIQLYAHQQNLPSRQLFDMIFVEIKWYLKLRDRNHFMQSCDYFIKLATRYYGQFHPIFSQFYDILSSYHSSNGQYDDAIAFAKSSLVNVLKFCGINHQKTSECYYNLALIYIKANLKDQAFAHLKKSKTIFENNGKKDTAPYAIILLKLALLYLSRSQMDLCLDSCSICMQILEREQLQDYEDQVAECYEMMIRCYQLMRSKSDSQRIAKECGDKLKYLSNPLNLQKILKIYLHPILSSILPQNASIYLDIISLMNINSNEDNYMTSFSMLKERITEQTFTPNLNDYIEQLISIQRYITQSNILSNWEGFNEVYARQTINDFISLSEELIVFLGEGFISGSLREAL